ncbi:unnamed protein product [Closterium sp. Naga37s-1]|nr:unnamed protein product [Closterium sp. Naga37s-1]
MAGSADPPTDVSLGGTSLASDASQWKLVAPGVWDLTRSLDWVTIGSALTGGRAAVTHAGVNGDTLTASGSLATTGSLDTGLPVLPSMARGRFQAMFSGAVAGGAKIRIATSTSPWRCNWCLSERHHTQTHLVSSPPPLSAPYLCPPSLSPLSAPPLCSPFLPPLSAPPLCPLPPFSAPHVCPPSLPLLTAPPACNDTKVTLEVHLVFIRETSHSTHLVLSPHLLYLLYPLLPPLSAPPACSDTKVALEIHLAFTKGVNTNSKVSLVGQVGADKSAPLALECPFTSAIKGVFTCSKTIDVKIPAETATTPKVLGLQKFMAALVGATMSGDNRSEKGTDSSNMTS